MNYSDELREALGMARLPDDLAGRHPLTWSFHRNSSRWAHNVLGTAGDSNPQPAREFLEDPYHPLPPPHLPACSLGDLLAKRYSCRAYEARSLAMTDLGTLLHTAYGVWGRSQLGVMGFLERPVPSGGGMYPLELYLLARGVEGLEPGLYHYAIIGHGLEQRREVQLPKALADYLFMGQAQLTEAPAIIVIAAVFSRSLTKYRDRGYRYILFEAGHVAQNLNLAALALELGSCNIGGFFDDELGGLMRTGSADELPLYAIAVGHPVPGDRATRRNITVGG